MKDTQPEQPAVPSARERILPAGPHDADPHSHVPDLNAASLDQLAAVDFIGAKLAHMIVEQRSHRGGFRAWSELAALPGMDAKRVAELQRAMRLHPPSD